MHPAISVIFFTVLSGAGFGMIATIGLDYHVGFILPDEPLSVFILSAVGVGLAVAGLISSTFHLGRPQKVWRAFSQWRSSWLSREGIAAVLTLCLYGIYALNWMFTGERIIWLGVAVSIGAIFTVFTTSMIYAQMKTVPHWHTRLTPAVYLAFSLTTGLLLSAGFGETISDQSKGPIVIVIIILLISWALKVAWWQRAGKQKFDNSDNSLSTIASATGLGNIGKVRLLERPHSGENYLTREMVHIIGRKHTSLLKAISMIVGGLIPLLIVLLNFISILPQIALILAAVIMIIGLFAERWLFFAQARHSVSLYY